MLATTRAVRAVAVAAAVLLGGCAGTGGQTTDEPTPAQTPTQHVDQLSDVDCARGWDPGLAPSEASDGVERAPLPDDFVPVAAVLCELDTDYVGAGPAVVTQRTAEGDLTALTEVLRLPDEPTPTADLVCTEQYEADPNLWLVDADGVAFAPRWPRDSCGHQRTPKSWDLLETLGFGQPVIVEPAA